ncbi:hypothetical protein Ga0100231_006280 [Opitutaceae bacterium TAV4]|nr:hypothetical protein Ga0100231_006280 [Opitutaceae bacterium TAV4]
MANVPHHGNEWLDTVTKPGLGVGKCRADTLTNGHRQRAIAAQPRDISGRTQANVLTTAMRLDTVDKLASIREDRWPRPSAQTPDCSDTLATQGPCSPNR